MLAGAIAGAASVLFLVAAGYLTTTSPRRRALLLDGGVALAALALLGGLCYLEVVGIISGWWLLPTTLFIALMFTGSLAILAMCYGEILEIKEEERFEHFAAIEPLREEDVAEGIDWDEVEAFLSEQSKS